jgi:hypothetical protein
MQFLLKDIREETVSYFGPLWAMASAAEVSPDLPPVLPSRPSGQLDLIAWMPYSFLFYLFITNLFVFTYLFICMSYTYFIYLNYILWLSTSTIRMQDVLIVA